jgi:hypothetical protein
MKNVLIFLSLFFCNLSLGQTTIIDGGTSNIDIPMDCYYRYNYSEMIYLQSEINQAGEISEIQLKWNGNSGWTEPIKVYMGHTSKSVFANNTDWVTSGSMSLVYDGDITVTTTDGWVSITLDNVFNYNNSDNLVIGIDENGYDYHSTSDNFYSKSTPSNYRTIYYNNDYTNPDPASPPTGGTFYYVPNLKLSISNILPIQLMSFDVKLVEDKLVEITWVTASEINCDYFEVEKLVHSEWEVVDKVYGTGWSSYFVDYKTYDRNINYGVSYYRLKQVDFNGDFEYFKVVSINIDGYMDEGVDYIYIDILGREVSKYYTGFKIIKKL